MSRTPQGKLKKPNDLRVAPHFKLREFQCPCCGLVRVQPELIERLERLRALWGAPLVISSGWRCLSRNARVGGAPPRSLHLSGRAADIVVPRDAPRFAALARTAGFVEVIPYAARRFVHVGL